MPAMPCRRFLLLPLLAVAFPGTAAEVDNTVAAPQLVTVPVEGEIALSVEEAVALALQHNPELTSERQAPIVAGSFEQVERARFDPTLFGEVGASRALTQQQRACALLP